MTIQSSSSSNTASNTFREDLDALVRQERDLNTHLNFNSIHNNVPDIHSRHVRRRNEDVEYWRKRAGWFDDDTAMKNYNSGIYDAYYQLDDDKRNHNSSSGSGALSKANTETAKIALKVLSVVIALSLCIMLLRAILRRLSDDSSSKSRKDKKRSDSKSRSGSKSRSSRSRSRSRSRKTSDQYELMDTDDNKSDARSKRSSRSKSRSRRSSRSRSRARSQSKSRREKISTVPEPKEPVLV